MNGVRRRKGAQYRPTLVESTSVLKSQALAVARVTKKPHTLSQLSRRGTIWRQIRQTKLINSPGYNNIQAPASTQTSGQSRKNLISDKKVRHLHLAPRRCVAAVFATALGNSWFDDATAQISSHIDTRSIQSWFLFWLSVRSGYR